VNPFEKTIEMELLRHSHTWSYSDEGKRVLGNLKRASKGWEAEQEQKQQADKFAESVRPAVEHAKRTLATAQADGTVTVEELETLMANVELARAGKLTEYSAVDKEWRAKQSNKIVAAAVEVDSQARTLAAQRDELLATAYEPLKESGEPVYGDVYYPPDFHDPSKAGKTVREVIVPQ
jgi:predicted RNA-binding Zn ribbon-like protein